MLMEDTVSGPPLLSTSSLFFILFFLSLSIFYSLCSDEMQQDCEPGIKECSLRMRDEKRRVIERVKERVWSSWFDVQKLLMCRKRETKEDRGEREENPAGSE